MNSQPESVSANPKGINTKRSTAATISARIATDIKENRPDILAEILSRRVHDERYEDIAINEAEVLATIGATSASIRRSVVAKVCKTSLSKELTKQINSRILSKRPNNITDATRALAREANGQLYDWTDAIDDELIELSLTMVHIEGRHEGMPDWNLIAEHMKQTSDIELTPKQFAKHTRKTRLKRAKAK